MARKAKAVPKKAKRTYQRKPKQEAPQQDTSPGLGAASKMFTDAIQKRLSEPRGQHRIMTDARSVVLATCAEAIVSMQVTLQAITQAAVSAPNHVEFEEHT